jgi:hypothetical protein
MRPAGRDIGVWIAQRGLSQGEKCMHGFDESIAGCPKHLDRKGRILVAKTTGVCAVIAIGLLAAVLLQIT